MVTRKATVLVAREPSSPWLAHAGTVLVDSGPLQDESLAESEEKDVRHTMLVEALDDLNDREQHILSERRLAEEPKTLEELSQVYGVSRERVRQIEVRAFEKLQKAMMRIAGQKRLLPMPA